VKATVLHVFHVIGLVQLNLLLKHLLDRLFTEVLLVVDKGFLSLYIDELFATIIVAIVIDL